MLGLGVILVIAIAYFSYTRGFNAPKIESESPIDILKRKYINGEIGEEEYLRKKEILEDK